MTLPWAEKALANLPRGEHHPCWKGDAATDARKRARAQKLYPLDGRECETPDCTALAVDRHHKDGNPGNNERGNIEFPCRRCHREGHSPARNQYGQFIKEAA